MIVLPSFSYFSIFFSKEGEHEDIKKLIPARRNKVHVNIDRILNFERHFMAFYPISTGALLMVKYLTSYNTKSAESISLYRLIGSAKPLKR